MSKRFADLRLLVLDWSVDRPSQVTSTSVTAIDNFVRYLTGIQVSVINTVISDHYGQHVDVIGLQPTGSDQRSETRGPQISHFYTLCFQKRKLLHVVEHVNNRTVKR
ncbi:hypothetical protein J6590_036221 [Homalodisca vitripennis]|nr:hypothetical protein J6590_036221 [Homalodisca vitripennis]